MNAAVLPVPVCAQPIRSRPSRSGGMAFSWMGVGMAYPASAIAYWRRASSLPNTFASYAAGGGSLGSSGIFGCTSFSARPKCGFGFP